MSCYIQLCKRRKHGIFPLCKKCLIEYHPEFNVFCRDGQLTYFWESPAVKKTLESISRKYPHIIKPESIESSYDKNMKSIISFIHVPCDKKMIMAIDALIIYGLKCKCEHAPKRERNPQPELRQ